MKRPNVLLLYTDQQRWDTIGAGGNPLIKTPNLDTDVNSLSGGNQQKVLLGKWLATAPEVLILDEPTEGIQPNVVQEIGDIIRKLNREAGLTVLLVEQKLPFARKVADRFCILDRGRQVASGGMEQLDDTIIQQYLTV